MVIAVLSLSCLPVEAGARGHVDLAAEDRTDARVKRRLVKVDDAVHGAVIRDGERIHAQLFCPGYDLFDLAGAVQQGILCVNVQMCKCHRFSSLPVNAESA